MYVENRNIMHLINSKGTEDFKNVISSIMTDILIHNIIECLQTRDDILIESDNRNIVGLFNVKDNLIDFYMTDIINGIYDNLGLILDIESRDIQKPYLKNAEIQYEISRVVDIGFTCTEDAMFDCQNTIEDFLMSKDFESNRERLFDIILNSLTVME